MKSGRSAGTGGRAGAPAGQRPMSLLARVHQVASLRGEQPAVVVLSHRGQETALSWREFAGAVARTVAQVERDTHPGAVVAVRADNHLEAVVRMVAVLAAGRTLLPLDPRGPESSQARLIEQVRHLGGMVQETTPEGAVRSAGGSPADLARPPAFGDGGYLLATGGSTGAPKPVYWPRAPRYDPRAVPSALLRRTGWRDHQTQLLAGPLHHAAPFSRLVDGVLSGNTMVIPRVFRPAVVVDALAAFRVEWTQLTPSNLRLLDGSLATQAAAFESLRGMLHTAAPCPADTKRNWIAHLGGGRVHEMYTATEGIGATLCDGDEWLARPGTVGRGFFTRIRVAGPDGMVLPAGQVGEVYMRSLGAGRPAAQPPTRDSGLPGQGFASVGDRGYLDDDGYLFLSGRRDDLVIVGGENVYTSQVASVILSCPGVDDATVVAVPDPVLGDQLWAVVVPRPAATLTADEVLAYCETQLAPQQLPAEVKLVDTLPRTAAGKLDRDRLSRLVTSIRGGPTQGHGGSTGGSTGGSGIEQLGS